MKQPDILFDLVSKGVLTQVNSGSIAGLFGSTVRDFAFNPMIRFFFAEEIRQP
jgi:tyrosine-protein phosphatase YwqE